jgi:hypothetical protein
MFLALGRTIVAAAFFSAAASEVHAQTCVNGGSCNPSSLNKILYVDGVTYSLQSAITAANSSGHTTVILPSNQTVSGGLALTAAGVELICQNNATLISGSGGFWMLTMSGSHQAVRNCTFSAGNYSGAQALLVNGATNAMIEGNTISGFRAGNGLIYLVDAASPILRNNRITTGSGGPDCIFGEKNTTDADVDGNFVDESLGTSGSHAIAFHSTTAGDTVNGIQIAHNTILAGLNFCVEVGAFGGLNPSQVSVSNNTCRLMQNGGSGGYSIGATGSSITGNSFDANGYTATIAAYEIVFAMNTVVTGNSANIGQAWISTLTAAATINASSGITFTGNVLNGWGGGNALNGAGWGIVVGTGGNNSVSVSDNVVSGNVLVFPAGQGAGGIFQQCQTSASSCSNNVYSGNVFVGDSSANSLGFRIENDVGTTQNTLILGNSITELNYGIYVWNATVVGTRIYYNLFSTTGSNVIDNGTPFAVLSISADGLAKKIAPHSLGYLKHYEETNPLMAAPASTAFPEAQVSAVGFPILRNSIVACYQKETEVA